MSELFILKCPTCGASLQAAGESRNILCQHCGNKYLLDRKIEEMDESERAQLSPSVTYTNQPRQWIRVLEYDVFLHTIVEEKVGNEQVLYIEVEYENRTSNSLKYRHDQWIVFDKNGYTFEPAKDFSHPHLYQNGRIYLGMTRVLTPGMRLRGWFAFPLPPASVVEYLQFSAGQLPKTIEFRIREK